MKITSHAALEQNFVSSDRYTLCIVCGSPLIGKQTKFCSSICKGKHHQNYKAQHNRALTRKIEIIQAFGGKCSVCGYSKNLAALAFHHTDPAKKNFKLDMRSLSNRALTTVFSEL